MTSKEIMYVQNLNYLGKILKKLKEINPKQAYSQNPTFTLIEFYTAGLTANKEMTEDFGKFVEEHKGSLDLLDKIAGSKRKTKETDKKDVEQQIADKWKEIDSLLDEMNKKKNE